MCLSKMSETGEWAKWAKRDYFSDYFSDFEDKKLWERVNDSNLEAAIRRCSVRKMFIEISQNSQENTCSEKTLTQVFFCEFCEISRNTFFHRTPLVAASGKLNFLLMILTFIHCVKSVRIRSCSGPHFSAFELNTEKYSVTLGIHSEYGEVRTKITPNTDTFHAVIFT